MKKNKEYKKLKDRNMKSQGNLICDHCGNEFYESKSIEEDEAQRNKIIDHFEGIDFNSEKIINLCDPCFEKYNLELEFELQLLKTKK